MLEHKNSFIRRKLNKKGQIGEALTWVIATIIIFIVLAIFIYAANAMGFIRAYTVSSAVVSDIGSQVEVKTDLAFEINLDHQDTIKTWINAKNVK